MTGDNITPFPGKPADLPECPVLVERPTGYCDHPAIRIVDQERNLTCAKCGATLDPFDYLRRQALAIRRGWEGYAEAQRRIQEMNTKIAALQKEAKRLGALVRRLKAKEPPPVDFRKPL